MRLYIFSAFLLLASPAVYGEAEDIVQKMKAERAEACLGRSNGTDLQIGMSRLEILRHKFWNFPDNMSKSTTANGLTETYLYECDGYQPVRLVLVNGKLVAIHQ